ncbi:hypothetical protein [Ktedonobacter sp. SOSP1-85]|nr:hypothetical protein [Ktedonobacter sp. SOSP1-85]
MDTEIRQIVAQSREGQILISIPGIGPIQAAAILADASELRTEL